MSDGFGGGTEGEGSALGKGGESRKERREGFQVGKYGESQAGKRVGCLGEKYEGFQGETRVGDMGVVAEGIQEENLRLRRVGAAEEAVGWWSQRPPE